MIVDSLDQLESYVALHPSFSVVADFIRTHQLNELPTGRINLDGARLFVNVVEAAPKQASEAKLETHDRMIDIQLPISATETIGYTPRVQLTPAAYNDADDISFYTETPQTYLTISPGMFAVFFPGDGHAPAISANGLKKIIIKVAVNN